MDRSSLLAGGISLDLVVEGCAKGMGQIKLALNLVLLQASDRLRLAMASQNHFDLISSAVNSNHFEMGLNFTM